MGDVSLFFTELNLEAYTAAVAENEVDGHTLQELVVTDGLSDLGVTKPHAIKIKRALKVAADDLAQTGCAPLVADDDPGPSKACNRRAAVANSVMHLVRTKEGRWIGDRFAQLDDSSDEEQAKSRKDEPKAKKAKKDPNAPKQPGTGYDLFCEAERTNVRTERALLLVCGNA